jgi:type IX secretion system PorP/SprF family membrane protein
MAGGLSVYNDKAGDSKMGTLQANLSLAMSFPLNKKSSLAFGLQGSTVQRKIDNTKLLYPNQYNGTTFDSNLPTGENYTQQNFSYPELGAGILWSYGQGEKSIAANDQIKALIGFSTYHINQPKQKFIGGQNSRLYRKYVFHGNILIGIPNSMFAIVPSWLVQLQGSSKEIVAGTMVKYYINDDSKYTGFIKRSSVGLGVYYRNADAIIASVLIETGRYSIGFSYDINASGLAVASKSRGGFEINLKFVTPAAYLYQRKSKAMFN